MRIFEDARVRPDLFVWYGRPAADSFTETAKEGFPLDLLSFWDETGGGDIFETESILGPADVPDWGDSLLEVNQQLHQDGLPAGLTAIHIGGNVTAIDGATKEYVVVGRQAFDEIARYSSLDEWYLGELRATNAARYGLEPIVG